MSLLDGALSVIEEEWVHVLIVTMRGVTVSTKHQHHPVIDRIKRTCVG